MATKPEVGKRKWSGAVRSIDDDAAYINRLLTRLLANNLLPDEKSRLVAEALAALGRILSSNRTLDEIGRLANDTWAALEQAESDE